MSNASLKALLIDFGSLALYAFPMLFVTLLILKGF